MAEHNEKYNDLYKRGCELVSRHMNLDGELQLQSSVKTAALEKGVALLEEAITLAPQMWACWWMIGKAYQALHQHDKAVTSFFNAWAINNEEINILREYCLELLYTKDFEKAYEIGRRACDLAPNDWGLKGNLGLVTLLQGKIDESLSLAEEACKHMPDVINKMMLGYVKAVKEGRAPIPKCIGDVEAYEKEITPFLKEMT